MTAPISATAIGIREEVARATASRGRRRVTAHAASRQKPAA